MGCYIRLIFIIFWGILFFQGKAQPQDSHLQPPPEDKKWKEFRFIREQLDSLKNLEKQFKWIELNAEAIALEGEAIGMAAIGKFEEAERLFKETLHIYKQRGDSLSMARVHNQMAAIYNRRGAKEDARRHWQQAGEATRHMVTVTHSDLAPSPDSLAIWSFTYPEVAVPAPPPSAPSSQAENHAATKYQKLLAEMKASERARVQDSITMALVLQEQAQKLEILRQEKEIESLELSNQLATLEQQQTRQYALLGGLALSLALIAVFGILFFTKRRAHLRLQHTHEQLKSAQAQLVATEKMASLGQLTAGIAHEINNPINYVAGNIVPLKRDLHELREWIERYRRLPEEQDPENLRNAFLHLESQVDWDLVLEEINQLLLGIEEGAQRTKEIVLGLRNFSRLDENAYKLADLHSGLDSTLTLLNNRFRHRITVHRDYGEVPRIECIPGKLNQVFMNLLTNAEQAMPEEGEIHIQTRLISEGKDPEFPAEHVRISIRDTGSGMPQSVREKVFDPFFTTKPIGQGTGLGLSISYGIVKDHNGNISVKSEDGKGTEFILTLPVVQKGE